MFKQKKNSVNLIQNVESLEKTRRFYRIYYSISKENLSLLENLDLSLFVFEWRLMTHKTDSFNNIPSNSEKQRRYLACSYPQSVKTVVLGSQKNGSSILSVPDS